MDLIFDIFKNAWRFYMCIFCALLLAISITEHLKVDRHWSSDVKLGTGMEGQDKKKSI